MIRNVVTSRDGVDCQGTFRDELPIAIRMPVAVAVLGDVRFSMTDLPAPRIELRVCRWMKT